MKNTEYNILKTYRAGETSLRDVAKMCETDHHRVKRVLESNDIEVVKAKGKPLSAEHRRKIGEASKGRKTNLGKKMPKASLYKNMASHLRFDVSCEWLSQFRDIEKLKFLNMCITDRSGRFNEATEWYVSYIEKFYSDQQFNRIYQIWISGGKDKYLRPTIDHITPRASGGKNDINNLQFLSWFENRAKCDMTQAEWDRVKENINQYLV